MSWENDFNNYIVDNRYNPSALPVAMSDYLAISKVDMVNVGHDRVLSLGYLGEVIWEGLIRDKITGLEYIEESGVLCIPGWRLIGRNPLYYGNIGYDAVDFSASAVDSDYFGATGVHSFAVGDYVIASGEGAVAIGNYVNTINDWSFNIGQFNVGTSVDTIFELGIGTSDVARLNAFEVYDDGTARTPEATIAEITSRGDKTLITLEYLTSALGAYAPLIHHTQHEIGGFDEVSIDNGYW